MTGYVEFTLVPAGTPIGQGGIVPDRRLGLASVTIVKQAGKSGVYGVPPPGSYTGRLGGIFLLPGASWTNLQISWQLCD